MSGRPCKICSTPGMAKVANRMLRTRGATHVLATLHERFPDEDISLSSVRRHRDNHMNNQYQREEPGVGSADRARVDASSGADSGAGASHARAARATPTVVKQEPTTQDLAAALKRGPLSEDELAAKLGVDSQAVFFLADRAHREGMNIDHRGGQWYLDAAPPVGSLEGTIKQFVADKNGQFTFAVSTDEHLCSKYAREDCLNDFYDHVVKRGITTVFNCGNMIDGLMPFNQHEITHHGLADQTRHLVSAYPQRAGIDIHSIWGADHEGWASRREGIDVGRYIETAFREAGREDWHNLGFAEAFVEVIHPATGKGSKILLTHPGGGSAYATSYFSQKLAESFGGGEKPALVLIGHLHKLDYTYARSIHLIQCGTFQSQSLFMRSKKLAAHVGGVFCTITVDPRTGAFHECSPTFRTYYDATYENARWSQHGPVRQPRFGVGGQ